MTEPMEQDDDEPLSKVVEREDPGDTGLAKNSSGQPFLFFFFVQKSQLPNKLQLHTETP